MRIGSFQSCTTLASSKQELEHSFTCGQRRKGGAIYCKCLSDAIQPPLSKTEFIQALVTSSRKMPLLWMYTDQTTRLQTRDELARPIESRSTDGEESSWLHQNSPAALFLQLALTRESLTDKLPSLFHESTAGRFPLCLAVKTLPKNVGLWFRTRNLGIISNLATVAT